MLGKNEDCETNLSFLGGGCWQHHVPAICDEIVGRSEFLTPVWGTPSSDLGRNQAWFEFTSQLGELVEHGAGRPARLQLGLRRRPRHPHGRAPDRSAAKCSCRHHRSRAPVGHPQLLRAAGDGRAISPWSLVGYRCRPPACSILPTWRQSCLRPHGRRLYRDAELSRRHREPARRRSPHSRTRPAPRLIVGVDPISLGVLAPPADYGADIVVGTTQPLGVHMNCGGGVGGFIASRDEERYAREYPTLLVSHHRDDDARRSRLRPEPRAPDPPTARARRARTGPAIPSISGRSPTPSTWR